MVKKILSLSSMKFLDLPEIIIHTHIAQFLQFKELYELASSSDEVRKILFKNSGRYEIINASNTLSTEDAINYVKKTNEMDTDKYTYFISKVDGDIIYYVYFPNDMKRMFIDSKIIII